MVTGYSESGAIFFIGIGFAIMNPCGEQGAHPLDALPFVAPPSALGRWG